MKINTLAGQVEALLPQIEAENSVAGLAKMQTQLAQATKIISLLQSQITEKLFALMDEDKQFVPGVGIVAKTYGSASMRWDHERLWSSVTEIAQRETVDPNTGEVTTPTPQDTMHLVRTVIGSPAWKKSGLIALNLSPANYGEASPGKRSIKIEEVKGA